jgi:protein-disulfide isomerase
VLNAQEIEGDGKPSPAWDRPPLPDMALGPAVARVTVIEYASASCPHCAEFHISHFGALKAAYINKGKIRFVLREYPHNDAAVGAFMLARCAPPGRYFDYLDRFFTTQNRWTNAPREGLAAIALELGIAQSDFERCMADEKLAKAIVEGRNLARSHGVETVPTFYIDGELHTGDKTYEALSAEIDKRLGK